MQIVSGTPVAFGTTDPLQDARTETARALTGDTLGELADQIGALADKRARAAEAAAAKPPAASRR